MIRTFTEKRFFQWYEDDICVSLRAKSASYGGGSEALIITDEGRNGTDWMDSRPSDSEDP